MKRNKYLVGDYNVIITFLICCIGIGCSDSDENKNESCLTDPLTQKKSFLDRELNFEITELTQNRLITIDSIMNIHMNKSHPSGANVFNSMLDSISESTYEFGRRLNDSIFIGLNFVEEEQVKVNQLVDSLVYSFELLTHSMNELDAYLYPSSLKWGYSERMVMLYYVFNEYLNNEVLELLNEYPDLRDTGNLLN